ncbi:hydroxymethylpyrimidine/phosphomethylpyrimidine kinase [Lentisphaera profundi]|uniref:hydroxymethylpyrimidine kinase n=1 Tax=Lentisphaera profundi TaxID=1658616 RepID=A0ABY7VN10_9BACT|nr:hydroxymethylpyrimidine/phosphomethylpyrimidine kinase [Lentisphaera profundi]WDE95463.1 hydroxymethylpyrimidine/phosphomethylpyrimidine kinase [Lentisphaera profundi]
MDMKVNTCLSVAGSDSGGEAGVQADLQVFNHYKCHALSVISANTAQSPLRVQSVNPVSITAFKDQLEVVFSDFSPRCMKTGVLVGGDYIESLLTMKPKDIDLVVDPLMLSTSGTKLLEVTAWSLMKDQLIPEASVVTPNYPELEYLSACDGSLSGMEMLQEYFMKYAVPTYLKGGHNLLAPSTDLFINSQGLWEIKTEALQIRASHGTGCRLSAAICAGLANGLSQLDAAIEAKKYLYRCLSSSRVLDDGRAVMAPLSMEHKEVQVEVVKLL